MPFTERQHKIWKTGRMLVDKFIADRCTILASALSFSSMLSIVPFLAILFAVLKALDVHTTLATMLLSNMAVGSQAIIARILRYINNTRVGSLGAIGLITLFMSILATLNNVEEAFNQICGIGRGKAVHHKLRDYLIVLFAIPLLTALAVTLATSLQHHGIVQWLLQQPGIGNLLLLRLTPYISIVIALVCLYLFIPNVQVSFRHAVAGSLMAGTIWQIAQWTFIHFQLGVSRHNAIYGTLSLLPVFMMWIYTSWIIVLAGMEIVWFLHDSTRATIQPGAGVDGESAPQTPAPQGFSQD
ncbi:MAG: YihY/virulence factor BrkB family protein [Geobacteraceae bacterium]|nr:YihY/virulence factor BrkB family protein [Geobacteraceae bacterium]